MKNSVRILAGLLATAAFPAMVHAGEVAGHVSDATGTRALQSASVRIVELNRIVETSRDGSYIFGDVPAGDYTLEVTYVGAIVETQTVSVPATGRVEGNFALAGIGGEAILVVGQTANLASSLSRQKAADGVSSVLTRDAIGQFPDQNVAESLRRLPGVNILNDQGEGRYVSVRGLDPDLNSTSLNGVRVPAPESDSRGVALDVVSSDLIESVTIKKSLTPDMDADTIGASIEIKTTSAFDLKKPTFTVTAEGSYNDYSDAVTPKGAFSFSAPIGDSFGISGGVSYYERKFETDNVESDFWADDDGVPYSETLEYRDYDVKRKRLNANLNFDWRVSDTTTAYIKGVWSQFDDHEYRNRTTFEFDEAPSAFGANGPSFSDEDGEIAIERDLKDRFERQRIRTVAVGSDTDTGTWKFNWVASWSKSTELEDNSVDPIRFARDFDGDGLTIDWDYSDPRVPTYTASSGAAMLNDPASYEFDKIDHTTLSDSQDEEWAIKADLARTFAMGTGDLTLQAGGKARWRKKSYDFNVTTYKDGDIPYTMEGWTGEQTYRLADISLGPVSYKGAGKDFLAQYGDTLEVDAYGSAYDSAVDDYSVKEDIYAGYALARWDSSDLRVVGGVRMEHTENQLDGNIVTDDEDNFELPPIEAVRYDRSYTDWLPSLTVRYSPQDNIVARIAGSKSLVRPKFSQLAPRNTVNEDNEAEFGNPELLPFMSWNFDAGVEYYFSSNGALTFNGFYKSIENYTYTQTFDDYTYEGRTYDEFRTALNGETAEIVGFEASYSQAFSMLPAPFDGLLTQLNYTYTHSKGELADGRSISLPSTSKNTFNAVLGYQKGPLNLRFSGTYRDRYLDEVGDDVTEDRYVDNHFQLDFSGKVRVTENVRLTLDVININNAKYFAYQNLAGAQRLLQFEKYGPTVKFGARVNF
ncbi:TonB-dependent receptor [Novosphingobium mangrovi (ex Hu et al. 2023)]|uniref:TonB-dependent receptor n=1 Tax=Novosphingobium mangrovi (ex Hu et al. 2023) TaxID=2930094 RepID=A0ABT0AAR5_9SPHN|nr:TonB-dependent receptor [Novosphingobium mangrovi (ex Hu et al. 2023)]MCJ1960295.1 TonB-dependent receptor [Novosphingobium mangrovi (ex Hu et al. 2023)]